MLVFDDRLQVVGWDQGMEDITGLRAEDVLGRPCWEVIGGLDHEGGAICKPDCELAQTIQRGQRVPLNSMTILSRAGRNDAIVSTNTGIVQGRPVLLHVVCSPRTFREMHPPDESLTPRQGEVLELLADGLTTREIGARLGIAHETARNHIQAILRRLDAHSRLEAVALARRSGLIP